MKKVIKMLFYDNKSGCRNKLTLEYQLECPGRDLNPHAVNRHHPLKVACLPIPPPGQFLFGAAKIILNLQIVSQIGEKFN